MALARLRDNRQALLYLRPLTARTQLFISFPNIRPLSGSDVRVAVQRCAPCLRTFSVRPSSPCRNAQEGRERGCEREGAGDWFGNVSGNDDGVLLLFPRARRASGRLYEGVELGPSAVRCRHLRLRELDIDLSDGEWETFSHVPARVRTIRFRSSKSFKPAPADKLLITYSPTIRLYGFGEGLMIPFGSNRRETAVFILGTRCSTLTHTIEFNHYFSGACIHA